IAQGLERHVSGAKGDFSADRIALPGCDLAYSTFATPHLDDQLPAMLTLILDGQPAPNIGIPWIPNANVLADMGRMTGGSRWDERIFSSSATTKPVATSLYYKHSSQRAWQTARTRRPTSPISSFGSRRTRTRES